MGPGQSDRERLRQRGAHRSGTRALQECCSLFARRGAMLIRFSPIGHGAKVNSLKRMGADSPAQYFYRRLGFSGRRLGCLLEG